MNRFGSLALVVAALLAASGTTLAQQRPLKDDIVGTWKYVSVDLVQPDGTRVPLYGPEPQGLATFDAAGNYLLMTARKGQPRFASSNREEGTPEENRSVVRGSIAHFGRYTIDESAKSITFHIQTSTFPNWNGTDQKRPVTISGDTLKWVTPSSTGAGVAEVVLQRAR